MKHIANYEAQKYDNESRYHFIETGIYLDDNPPDEILSEASHGEEYAEGFRYRYGSMFVTKPEEKLYVTSLSFEQEPELGEGDSPANISQYPLEDVLDYYSVHISDFYEAENANSEQRCYLEFASPDLEKLQSIQALTGRHVYNFESEGSIHLAIKAE